MCYLLPYRMACASPVSISLALPSFGQNSSFSFQTPLSSLAVVSFCPFSISTVVKIDFLPSANVLSSPTRSFTHPTTLALPGALQHPHANCRLKSSLTAHSRNTYSVLLTAAVRGTQESYQQSANPPTWTPFPCIQSRSGSSSIICSISPSNSLWRPSPQLSKNRKAAAQPC
uniref:Uncharacterized protein n=1 Tax=Palpitomonas bilix TaxID=652834 RepID=A0A7S3CWX1_9EUKA